MDELPRLSRTHRKAAIQVATLAAYKVADFGVARARRGYFGAARAVKLLFKSPFGGQTPESAFCTSRRPIFLCPKGLRRLRAPGADFFVKFEVPQRQQLASETRTPEGCSAHRISIPYTRSPFFAPSVFENTSRTPGGLF